MHFISLFCPRFYGESQIRFLTTFSFRRELGPVVHHVLKLSVPIVLQRIRSPAIASTPSTTQPLFVNVKAVYVPVPSHSISVGKSQTVALGPSDVYLRTWCTIESAEFCSKANPNLEFRVRTRAETKFLNQDTILLDAFHISVLPLL